jgi:3-methyladenine DNA glycosylase/8-oxoguanine DNA glycosylase
MPSRFTIPVPRDYLFHRDVCSYGYFLLAPNLWDPRARTLTRPLELSGGVAVLTLAQPGGKRGESVAAVSDRGLSKAEKSHAARLITRMLALDDAGVAEFHRLDPRFKRSGRGRLFRSPTFFEDLVKTVTSCNVAWPSTMSMNARLCEQFNPAFPSARQLARKKPATLRARCGVGYRDARLVELARLVGTGEVDPEWFEDPATPDDAVHEALLELPGIGPYAAANVMQLLGRYSRLPLDSESVRHGKTVLGFQGVERQIMKRLHAHYEPFGAHKFRSYWFEVWEWYEAKRGPAWTWDPHTTGRTFTASKLADRPAASTRPRRSPSRAD